jgi:hypothetical protein
LDASDNLTTSPASQFSLPPGFGMAYRRAADGVWGLPITRPSRRPNDRSR